MRQIKSESSIANVRIISKIILCNGKSSKSQKPVTGEPASGIDVIENHIYIAHCWSIIIV